MEQALDIIACGHLCLDLLPQMQNLRLEALASPGRLFEVGPMGFSTGGSVSNTGLALHRLGANVRLMSSVGDDQISHLILDFLQRRDPAITEYVKVKEGLNGSYTLVLSPKDVDRMFLQYAGTNATFSSADIDYAVVSRAKILHLGYPPLLPALIAADGVDLACLFARAKESGVVTSLDMSLPDPAGASGQVDWRALLRRTLPHVDIFIPSLEEIVFMLRRSDFDRWGTDITNHVTQTYLESLTGELLSMGSCIAGIKLGAYGIYVRTGGVENFRRLARLAIDPGEWADRNTWHPAFEVDVAGTTGAGDSAYAGFLTAMLKGLPVESAARWACAAGACNVEAVDSTSGVQPWDATRRRLDAGWQVRPLRIRQ
ncbi:MAG: carbohydrate kinase family protein [Anaerolineae bacterium]|nr:carbohydrate kinase family protein [Anaerolineae bacterium]